MLNFEDFQEKVVEGEFAACFVNYTATLVDVDTEEVVGYAKVVAEKDELIDFVSAVSDEACRPILDKFKEELPDDQWVESLDVKFILTKTVNIDGSVTYVAFTPDGRTRIINLSAHEVFMETLSSLMS